MRFSIPFVASIALAFGSQYVMAQHLTGIKLPESITPGQEFNVTYQWMNGLSNCEEYMAIYGITSEASVQNSSTLGSEPFATFDLSKLQVARNFNATLRAPDYEFFKPTADYNNGTFPNPWYITSANIEQIGASGGVALKVYHASTHVNY